jgi:hypothetical protein
VRVTEGEHRLMQKWQSGRYRSTGPSASSDSHLKRLLEQLSWQQVFERAMVRGLWVHVDLQT